jgi:hypothetical protein
MTPVSVYEQTSCKTYLFYGFIKTNSYNEQFLFCRRSDALIQNPKFSGAFAKSTAGRVFQRKRDFAMGREYRRGGLFCTHSQTGTDFILL